GLGGDVVLLGHGTPRSVANVRLPGRRPGDGPRSPDPRQRPRVPGSDTPGGHPLSALSHPPVRHNTRPPRLRAGARGPGPARPRTPAHEPTTPHPEAPGRE